MCIIVISAGIYITWNKSASTRYTSANERTMSTPKVNCKAFPLRSSCISLSCRKRAPHSSSSENTRSNAREFRGSLYTRRHSRTRRHDAAIPLSAAGKLPYCSPVEICLCSILEFRARPSAASIHKEMLVIYLRRLYINTLNCISIINRTHELTNQFLLRRK